MFRGGGDSSSPDNIHITKPEAARRQLSSAVRLYFNKEDALVVHTVASAGEAVVNDLRNHRGHDVIEEWYLVALYGAVSAMRCGELHQLFGENHKAMALVREWASYLPSETEASTFEEFKEVVNVRIPPDLRKRTWKEWKEIANFLKHSDRDGNSHIRESETKNLRLLIRACSSYRRLVPNGLMAELQVLDMYSALMDGTRDGFSDSELNWIATAEQLSADERFEYFSDLLATMKDVYDERGLT